MRSLRLATEPGFAPPTPAAIETVRVRQPAIVPARPWPNQQQLKYLRALSRHRPTGIKSWWALLGGNGQSLAL
ncbi:MAG: hypothetical protein IPL79_10595 [Myxococcales bacterium]|nr:hypothetical protein [Myxococcales bacterium]